MSCAALNPMPETARFRRDPSVVMRLARLGSAHPTRLSFLRTLLRRVSREGWRIDRPVFAIDAKGVGRAVYAAQGPERTYSLVCFAHDLPDHMRSDRVIATALLSLAEIEALGLKAARGAGFSWGMAEEAAMAVRWLAAHGLPGPALLLRHLEAVDRRPWAEIAPVIQGRVWRTAGGGALCPIAAGAAMADRATLVEGPGLGAITLEQVADPGLLLPFAASAATALDQPLRVAWDGFSAVVGAAGVALETGETGFLETTAARVVVVAPAEPRTAWRQAEAAPRLVPLPIWQGLDRFAFRTYVPASEASRAGAGASTSDND